MNNHIWSAEAIEAMKLWRSASTFEELCELTARFMEGAIKFVPNLVAESLDEESTPIAVYLAAFNRAGFLTNCSQPGYDYGHSKQRAFVTGLASEPTALKIQRLSLTTDLYICVSYPGANDGCKMPVTIDYFRPYAWAGDVGADETTGEFYAVRDYREHCSARAILELEVALSVTIIDLCWGRTDYLWHEVAKELCFSIEPHDD